MTKTTRHESITGQLLPIQTAFYERVILRRARGLWRIDMRVHELDFDGVAQLGLLFITWGNWERKPEFRRA